MPRPFIAILIVSLLIGLAMWRSIDIGRGSDTAAFATYSQSIMASPVTVVAPADHAAEAAEIVFGIFRDIDLHMSEWKPESPLTAVNNAAGERAVEVPDDLMRVVRRGLEIGDMTEGAFDITWAALWGLWDFQSQEPSPPELGDINQRVALVNYREVLADDEKGTVFLPRAGMKIGLGGIAKGTALNRSAEALTMRGFDDFLISAGGQVISRGRRGDSPWRVGIRDPRGAPDDYFATIELKDVSVATSGDYERFFIRDGVRYHHILDPRTGMPASGMRSATIVCADAELADGLATAAMILGAERTIELVERLPDVEALLVDGEGHIYETADLNIVQQAILRTSG